jgi:hypothetical protein
MARSKNSRRSSKRTNSNVKPAQKPLYGLEITLTGDVELKNNIHQKPYALAKGTVTGGPNKDKSRTVMTYVKSGIAALTGLKAGTTVRLFGTYQDGTFSAMGISTPKAAVVALPAEAPAALPIAA